ncbi:uncharacterized protein LOC126101541 [Schistocerca cancellata]|uniref:uncharacterized protein LOC126101541 n=1 Tax=Schistocerca cancellata TaxID=274614 RepID=UPI0021176CFD|nr:uncharacterized protein LOC126101541 [Schistocerca cancellata]
MDNITLKERYYKIRKETQRTLRQEKRKHYNNMVREAEDDFKHHRARQMYQNIKKSLGKFTKREQFIKDHNGKILTNKNDIQETWKTYFTQLLNCNDPQYYFTFEEPDTVDIQVTTPSVNEIRQTIKKLKNNKACGEDQVYAELLKNGGPQLEIELHSLTETIWETEN